MWKFKKITDKHNSNKIWLIKRYDCGHYYANQLIFANNNYRLFYSRYQRVSKQHLVSVLGKFDMY